MVKGVLELASKFMEDPYYVTIDEASVNAYCNDIRKEINKEPYFIGEPKIALQGDELQRIKQIVIYELMASSVNYKYWYGKYDVRPYDSCANKMYEMLDSAFDHIVTTEMTLKTGKYISDACATFQRNLTHERFPMIRERTEHLKEVVWNGDMFANEVAGCIKENRPSLSYLLELLIVHFPGFSEDMFLKRAFLFFMMLYRRMGWFADEIHELPIPADYQIPKILNAEGCLKYHYDLKDMLSRQEILSKGSRIECEIRAASIIACQKIATECGVSMCKVDDYLWLKRKEYDMPFHLTVTTDY